VGMVPTSTSVFNQLWWDPSHRIWRGSNLVLFWLFNTFHGFNYWCFF
jgi:hypothetical protein